MPVSICWNSDRAQLGRAQRAVGELVGAAEQGAADLVQVERQVGFGKAEDVAELDDECKGIQRLWFPVAEFSMEPVAIDQ